jgi:hypothetical protein
MNENKCLKPEDIVPKLPEEAQGAHEKKPVKDFCNNRSSMCILIICIL